ncbi:hypothetical protein EHQ59_10510 [Leptospira kemamanensis]|uniref:Uncharacterized protein n=1 Tax=Leptospira kemamanensis TaxID=2484942 RepID=A0A4V6QM04_9LEPT|nr:hypothetical protein [Leptospira kemamanensis]TGL51330.1 hypothetical protein EHQ59_10510 [Leptospira kemamanensis]
MQGRTCFTKSILFGCLCVVFSFGLSAQDFKTQHFPEEGYLQAWNFSFRNEKYNLFATFLVSNFGPGSHNNGISLLLKTKDQPVFYSTREFDSEDYEFKKGQFYQRSGENWMEYKNGVYSFYMNYGDREIKLEYKPRRGSVPISKGKFPLMEKGKFVQADIPFSYSTVTGTIRDKDVVEEVKGVGGLEHILTNEAVYQYSKKWEIVRSQTKDGYRIFTGGFLGNSNFPGEFFRRVAVLNPSGHLLLEGTVEKVEVLEWEKEPTSGYTIPKTEILYFKEGTCQLVVKRTRPIATMSALENISSFLRFFIQLFFAKPYQIHWFAELKVDCPEYSGEGKGYHSNYLINE